MSAARISRAASFFGPRRPLQGGCAPDHLQPRPAALRRVEHQLVDQVADDGEAEPSLPVGHAHQVRDVEPATGIYDGYLDGPLEVVDVLGPKAREPPDLGHHEAGEQHVLRAARERERDRVRDPDPFPFVYLRGFALHQTSRTSGPPAGSPRKVHRKHLSNFGGHLTQMYTALTPGRIGPSKGARRRIGYLGALFPARCLTDLFGEPLARDVPHSLLVEALGFLFFLQPLPLRPRLVVAAGAVGHAQVGPKEVYGDGQDDGGVLLARDLAHRLKEPELQRLRALQTIRGLPEALGGLVLALGRYDLGPPLPLALGLARHRPLHLLRDLHVLDLHHADLDAPGVGLLVDDPLELLVYLLAVDEQVVEVLLPEHAA